MARPPLPIGTAGKITIKPGPGGKGPWVARTRFRDFDGVPRLIERKSTKSHGAAGAALAEAIRDRQRNGGDELSSDTRMAVAGEKWWRDEIEGQRAINTERRYKETLVHINAGLGGLMLREMTTNRCDNFLRAIAKNRGPGTAKVCKTVLSGILGMAARLDAIPTNPIRDVGRIAKPKKEVLALSLDEIHRFRAELRADRKSTLGDVVDPVDFMLGTGARVGEVFALRWVDVDLTAGTALIRGTTLWAKDQGMSVQSHPKTSTSRRTLKLPPFVVEMLERRDREPEMVFPSLFLARSTVRDPNNFRKQLRRFTQGTEWEWVTPHTFRKSVATLLDLADASSQLGHAGQHITEQHYRMKTHEGPDVRAQLQAIALPPVVPIGSPFTHQKQRA
jgi:integrase